MDPNNALAITRQTLPFIVRWGNVLFVLPLVLLLALLASKWANAFLLRPYQAAKDSFWTEQARLLYPARKIKGSLLYGFLIMGAAAGATYSGPFSFLSPRIFSLILFAAIFFSLRYLQLNQEYFLLNPEKKSEGKIPFNFFVPHLISGIYLLSVLDFSLFLPEDWSRGTFLLLLGGTAYFLVWSLFGRIYVMKFLGLLSEAPEKLSRAMQKASQKVGVTPRRVFVLKGFSANAMALPQLQWVLFTQKAVEDLSEEEIYAIGLHELGHLKEPFYLWGTRLLPQLFLLPVIAFRPLSALANMSQIQFIFYALLASLVGRMLLSIFFSHKMEVRADAVGKEHQEEEGDYARALEKIYRLNLMPAFTGKRGGSHPDLYHRLIHAGITPAYPKPLPPPKKRYHRALLLFLLLPALLLFLPKILLNNKKIRDRQYTSYAMAALALGGGSNQLNYLAWIESNKGDYQTALTHYQACTALDPTSVNCPSNAAMLLADFNRCSDAALADQEAQRRLSMLRASRSLNREEIEFYQKLLSKNGNFMIQRCGGP